MSTLRPALLLSMLALLVSPALQAGSSVLVSIKPLRLIVEALISEADSIETLIGQDASPHHYLMRPSDRLRLAAADLVVWIGPGLETELADILADQGDGTRILQAMEIPGLATLSSGSGHPGRELAGADPHLWLDADNAIAIARAVSRELALLEAEMAGFYSSRLAAFIESVEDREPRWRGRLALRPAGPYAVYHDAFRYLERRYGLDHHLVLVHDTEVQPGARQILEVRRAIADIRPRCLLKDPWARQPVIDTMLAGHTLNEVVLDVIGAQATGSDSYVHFMDKLVDDLAGCIQARATP